MAENLKHILSNVELEQHRRVENGEKNNLRIKECNIHIVV